MWGYLLCCFGALWLIPQAPHSHPLVSTHCDAGVQWEAGSPAGNVSLNLGGS